MPYRAGTKVSCSRSISRRVGSSLMVHSVATKAGRWLCRLVDGFCCDRDRALPERRVLQCMELEDRVLFNAAPAGGQALGNTTTSGAQQTSPQSPQAVAHDASGNFVAVWTGFAQNGDGSPQSNVYAQRFDASGNKQGSEI